MSSLPLSIGKIHFIGIGGIGMSGIAEVLNASGYQISGSDINENSNTTRKLGISIKIGHNKLNIENISIVVISTAVNQENEELIEAQERKIPIVHRSEMLCELMRLKWSVAVAGTHGKTTTTSLVSALLYAGNFDPTVINGGIIKNWGSNARLGQGNWMVVEADESDGSFSKLVPTVAIVTNIDPEHLDFHGTFENLEIAFQNFISSIPFYGFKVLCIDHPSVQRLVPKNRDRRLLTYGKSINADVRAINIQNNSQNSTFDLVLSNRIIKNGGIWKSMNLPMLGDHNILNCLAAITVAIEMGIVEEKIRAALSSFQGVKRRFEIKGLSKNGITVIDDYGHHPVEINFALKAARMLAKESSVIAVVQPHRYSRLKDLFQDFCSCFNDANYVCVADVYEAGETPIPNYDKNSLANGISTYGHQNVILLNNEKELASKINHVAKRGDVVILLGAGSITYWSDSLIEELNQLDNKNE